MLRRRLGPRGAFSLPNQRLILLQLFIGESCVLRRGRDITPNPDADLL